MTLQNAQKTAWSKTYLHQISRAMHDHEEVEDGMGEVGDPEELEVEPASEQREYVDDRHLNIKQCFVLEFYILFIW